MSNTDHIDSEKRQTIKLLAGLSSATLLASMPVSVPANADIITSGDLLDCKLISRADISRTHLLMHNRTDNNIFTNRLATQLIEFDDTLMNLEDAFSESVVIPPQDRVMIRLNTVAGLNKKTPYENVINMNPKTQYLPQGTRVVELAVRVKDGICTIDYPPIQA